MMKDDPQPTSDSIESILQDTIDILNFGYAVTQYKKITAVQQANNHYEANHSVSNGDTLEDIAKEVSLCQKCDLHATRRNAVSGEGAITPLVMVVGASPGEIKNAESHPFIGEEGSYLDKWLASIDLHREKNVFITNLVKCSPPHGREPHPDEYKACNTFLMRHIQLLQPKCILAVGIAAGRIMSCALPDASLSSMRLTMYSYANIPVFVTHHPRSVLRDPSLRKLVWEDMLFLQKYLQQYV